jgi:hypothetical protein
MAKDAAPRQQETPDQVQTPQERPQSPQPIFEPEQAEPQIGKDDIAQRAYAIYEQRGRVPGYDLNDWLQAERELINHDKGRNTDRRDERDEEAA